MAHFKIVAQRVTTIVHYMVDGASLQAIKEDWNRQAEIFNLHSGHTESMVDNWTQDEVLQILSVEESELTLAQAKLERSA